MTGSGGPGGLERGRASTQSVESQRPIESEGGDESQRPVGSHRPVESEQAVESQVTGDRGQLTAVPARGRRQSGMEALRRWARLLKRDGLSLWFASRDPQTPWRVKLLAAAVVAYALSPIDLIPDFIPVLGLLDDLILLPGLIWLALRLLPGPVLARSREKAEQWLAERGERPSSRVGAVLIVLLWIAVLAAIIWWMKRG